MLHLDWEAYYIYPLVGHANISVSSEFAKSCPNFSCKNIKYSSYPAGFDLFPTFFGDMGVNFSRFAAFMAQKFLDITQIHPFFEQVGGKRVAQGMYRGIWPGKKFPNRLQVSSRKG